MRDFGDQHFGRRVFSRLHRQIEMILLTAKLS